MLIFDYKFLVTLLILVCLFQFVFGDNVITSIIKEVLKLTDKNLIFSPLLLTEGLWQLYLATEGKTADEIHKVLQLNDKTKDQAIKDYANWRQHLIPLEDVRFHRANSLFLTEHINILPQYLKQAIELFQSEPQRVDFANSVATSTLINNWIAKHTNNTITKLIEQTNSNMKIIFLSAIYFKGSWKNQFESELTKPGDFYVPQKNGGTRTVKVDMMSRRGRYILTSIDKLDARSLELPYKNSNLSMIILLPNAVNGIDKLIEDLDQMHLKDIAPKTYDMQAKIYIPKFKLDVNLELKNALKAFGLSDLFDNANFSAMTDSSEGLRVEQIHQRAILEVDEKGATASTAKEMKYTFSYINFPMVEIEQRVDHPFVFIITDRESVYFAGKVTME